MRDLRLVGVHDDGEHLLLSGTDGEIYRLRIDEALRVASSRTLSRGANTMNDEQHANRLSPKDIQQRIRGGASAQEIAEASGVPLEHIQRYEGPVLAEREYVSQQARLVKVADAIPGHDGYRSAFGDDPANLGEMVAHRLTAYGIESESVVWDAWRRADGSWTVTADFEATPSQLSGIGESAPAQWIYHPSRKSLQNTNRWAQLLSEIAPLDSPLPSRRLSAVADRPFDIESERPAEPEESALSADSGTSGTGSESLLDLLRSRRGQRLGVSEDDDDALALLLSEGVPAAHPRNADPETEAVASEEEEDESAEPTQPSVFPPLALAPKLAEAENADDPLGLFGDISTNTREISIPAQPGKAPTSAADASTEEPETAAEPVERRPPIKPKRSSVPSWDEIVFGTKSDN
ncbi:septation protein SepH [Psychromicrobium sp. YIM B11713]|uniref:septation protein SepH n=1 Tax=Psychromicrobium sp. YIM B11713 TaxID=3145233 RepID=UPI00374E2C23